MGAREPEPVSHTRVESSPKPLFFATFEPTPANEAFLTDELGTPGRRLIRVLTILGMLGLAIFMSLFAEFETDSRGQHVFSRVTLCDDQYGLCFSLPSSLGCFTFFTN